MEILSCERKKFPKASLQDEKIMVRKLHKSRQDDMVPETLDFFYFFQIMKDASTIIQINPGKNPRFGLKNKALITESNLF
jgi:hypothetical protein